jgi:hypothetical protein
VAKLRALHEANNARSFQKTGMDEEINDFICDLDSRDMMEVYKEDLELTAC